MTTFKFKKIITGISLFTMIFSWGSNVNAMNVGHQTNTNATENYRNNIYYSTLSPKVQSEINQLHTLLSVAYKRKNRYKSQDDFIEILQHINVFLEAYNDKPDVKQKIIRVIGISSFKNGYVVNNHLLGQFLGNCKSRINLKFQKAGFQTQQYRDKVEPLKQIISDINSFDAKQWTFRLYDKQLIYNNIQNVLPLVNNNASPNNLAISNSLNIYPLPVINSFGISNPPTNNIPQNEQSLINNNDNQNNNEFYGLHPEDEPNNHDDYDPFDDLTTNWDNPFNNSMVDFDSNL